MILNNTNKPSLTPYYNIKFLPEGNGIALRFCSMEKEKAP